MRLLTIMRNVRLRRDVLCGAIIANMPDLRDGLVMRMMTVVTNPYPYSNVREFYSRVWLTGANFYSSEIHHEQKTLQGIGKRNLDYQGQECEKTSGGSSGQRVPLVQR